MSSALKSSLEDLLRARRLQADAPPLRGEDRGPSPLPTGIASIDALLGGGFPRGRISEVQGPPSSGRTGLVCSLVARVTREGGLGAWVDVGDHLDPAATSAAGVDLTRLLWLRGNPRTPVKSVLSALGTLLGSGLFDVVVLDTAGMPASATRFPDAAWVRFGHTIEGTPTALVLLASGHMPHGPRGASLSLRLSRPRWSGNPGPGRLFQGLEADVLVGRHPPQRATLSLQAVH